MKLPARSSSRRLYHQCGVLVDVQGKKQLRNRSIPLTNAQRHVLKQMGVKVDKNATEKEAVMVVKRIVTFESAYSNINYISKWTRKRRGHKPRGISIRQHKINVLMHRETTPFTTSDKDGNIIRHSGSKRAAKELTKI